MSTQPLRVGVIGTGGIAKHHLNNLKKIGGTAIVGLCDIEKPRADVLAKEFGGTGFGNIEEMLDTQKPELVLICTPPFARMDPVKAACERGIPFFCEKPPAFSVEDAVRVNAVVAKSNLIHSVGFMYRHKETTDRAKELLQGQTILAIRSTFVCGAILNPDFPAWFKMQDKSGGPLLDQAIHALDLIRYLVGDINAITAYGSNRVVPKAPDVTVNDTISMAFSFSSGLTGTHNHSWASAPGLAVIEVLCRDARLNIDLFENSLTGVVRNMKVEFKPGDDCYQTELKRFLQAVREKSMAPVRSTYEDAVKTLAVCCAANASAATGKPVAL